MRIAFANMLEPNYVKGHKLLDLKILQVLVKISQVDIFAPLNWYNYTASEVNNILIEYGEKKVGKYFHHRYSMCVVNKILEYDLMKRYDYIIFESYNTYVMMYVYLKIFNAKSRVYIMHHNNIDIIDNHLKQKLAFLSYCKKINHLVLAEYIREHLINAYDISPSKVHTISHPIVNNHKNFGTIVKDLDCVGISNSNDEEWVKMAIEAEKKQHFFTKHKIKTILRSKQYTFHNEYLQIINGYLDVKTYDLYNLRARTVFLPFPEDYKYRMSGVLIEALANGSVVICTKLPMSDYFSRNYPHICMYANCIEDLLLLLPESENKKIIQDEMEKFVHSHNDLNTERVIRAIFNKCK